MTTTTCDRQTEALWLSREDAADLIGVSLSTFDRYLRRRLPAEAVRGSGSTLRFYASDLRVAIYEHRMEQEFGPATKTCVRCGGPTW